MRTNSTWNRNLEFNPNGATNEGAFHEAMNMAAILKAPVVFVCENNLYGEWTSAAMQTSVRDIADRATAYGIPGVIVDGMDIMAVHEAASEAVARARNGDGPTLLECKTYRFYGHYVGDPVVYRNKEEAEDWIQNRDPLALFEARATESGVVEPDGFRLIDGEVEVLMREAVEEAERAPKPDPADLLTDVYVRYP